MNTPSHEKAHEKDAATKTTGRRYGSVAELMRGEGVSQEVQNIVTEFEKETHLSNQLALMRTIAGLTQEQMAERLNCSQSCISKWESGRDEDLDIRTLRSYAEATKQRIGLIIGQPLNHVEAIKLHVAGIQKRLLALAALARENGDLEADINAFFGEACFNIIQLLARCQLEMPTSGVEVRIQLLETHKPGQTPGL